MSNSKSYNKIIFLTTLCVGLAIVGVSPYLLHSLLLTKPDEIEVIEEFNDTQDDDKDFPSLVAKLISDIQDELKTSKSSLQKDFRFETYFYASSRNSRTSCESDLSNEKLNVLIQTYRDREIRPFAIKSADYNNDIKKFNIVFEGNDRDISASIFLSKDLTLQYRDFLDQKFVISNFSTNSNLKKLVYENTIVTSADNQNIISTRLPRGSIDSLLKQ